MPTGGYQVTQTWNVFPSLPGLTFNVGKVPTWKTLVQESASRMEATVNLGGIAIWEWELTYEFLRADVTNVELQQLLAFFCQQQGSMIPFCFSDPDDNAATAMQFGTGDGNTKDFQLVRFLVAAGKAGANFFDPVFAPTGQIKVYDNGSIKTPTTDFTVTTAGVVSFVSAPTSGHVLTWTGSYYWLVRFREDSSHFEKFMQDLWLNKKVAFRSIKL